MALTKPSSLPLSLLALPSEIHLAVLDHLQFLDLHRLRLTNHYFQSLIRPPTHAELLSAETTKFGFLACVGCTRLRPVASFSTKMTSRKKAPGGDQADNRFCIECGRRPLPGVHRYTLGVRWKETGVPFVRCLMCKAIARGPDDQSVRLCLSCHTLSLERARAIEERDRMRREAREREERRLLRVERRRNRRENGYSSPDFSSEDPSEQDDQEDQWNWQYAGSTYSGHS